MTWRQRGRVILRQGGRVTRRQGGRVTCRQRDRHPVREVNTRAYKPTCICLLSFLIIGTGHSISGPGPNLSLDNIVTENTGQCELIRTFIINL